MTYSFGMFFDRGTYMPNSAAIFLLLCAAFLWNPSKGQEAQIKYISAIKGRFKDNPREVKLGFFKDSLRFTGFSNLESSAYSGGIHQLGESQAAFNQRPDLHSLTLVENLDDKDTTLYIGQSTGPASNNHIWIIGENESGFENLDQYVTNLKLSIEKAYFFKGEIYSVGLSENTSGVENGFLLHQKANGETDLHSYSGLWPREIIFRDTGSYYLLGQVYQDQGWTQKGFVSKYIGPDSLEFHFQSQSYNGFTLSAGVFDQVSDQLILTGNFYTNTTNKQDAFIGFLDESSPPSIRGKYFGKAHFETVNDLLMVHDSLFYIFGSSEYPNNGITKPMVACFNRDLGFRHVQLINDLDLNRGYVGGFRGEIHSAAIRDTLVYFLGSGRQLQYGSDLFFGRANLSDSLFFCSGHIVYPDYAMSIPQVEATPFQTKQSLVRSSQIAPQWIREYQKHGFACYMPCGDSVEYIMSPDPLCEGDTLILDLSLNYLSPSIYMRIPDYGTSLVNNYSITRQLPYQIPLNFLTQSYGLDTFMFEGPCSASDTISIGKYPSADLRGPGVVCPGPDQGSNYSWSGALIHSTDLHISGGQLTSLIGNRFSIDWARNGEILLETFSVGGCKTETKKKVLIDSVLEEPPVISRVSWSGDSLLCLVNNGSEFEINNSEIQWEISGFWEEASPFSATRDYGLQLSESPSEGIRFRLVYLDHCNVPGQSPEHKTIHLEDVSMPFQARIRWEEYEGWPQADYAVIRTSPLRENLGPIETGQKIEGTPGLLEKECYRIIGIYDSLETGSNEVCIGDHANLLVANVITPNFDGKNDGLKLKANFDPQDLEWIIYNRNGVELQRFRGDPQFMDYSEYLPGVYYYTATGGPKIHWQGWFEVIR